MVRWISTVALAVIAVSGAAAPAHADPTACKGELVRLMDKWDDVGYPMPLKASQVRLLGKGHEATGQEVMHMRSEISLATRECDAGRETAALGHISNVSALLTSQSLRTSVQATR